MAVSGKEARAGRGRPGELACSLCMPEAQEPRPRGVPQFAQNFALSGFANPQFGQVIVKPTVSDFPTGALSEMVSDPHLLYPKQWE